MELLVTYVLTNIALPHVICSKSTYEVYNYDMYLRCTYLLGGFVMLHGLT